MDNQHKLYAVTPKIYAEQNCINDILLFLVLVHKKNGPLYFRFVKSLYLTILKNTLPVNDMS